MNWSDIVDHGEVFEWGVFDAPSANGLYGYGIHYGMNGVNHTGVDIAADLESTIYAPFTGRINCAGTGVGTVHDGSACAAFNDYFGSGAGRVELQSGDDVLIFGHSSKALVSPGDTVTAGQPIATSGGMNSPHTHLEARIPDDSTDTGWRIVNPADMVNGLIAPSKGDSKSGGHISMSKPYTIVALVSIGVVLTVVGARSLVTGGVLQVAKGAIKNVSKSEN